MSGNQTSRVDNAVSQVQAPLPGADLFLKFKSEMIRQVVFTTMFGGSGERIYIDKMPNLNDTILPCMLLAWKSETFSNVDTYFEGFVSMAIVLPVRLSGDYNALRRVGNMIQRFMGGTMNLFSGTNQVLGLTQFGFGADYNYEGLAEFDGLTCPVININLPFKFDLQLMQIQLPGFDLTGPLDQGDLGFVQEYHLTVIKDDNTSVLIPDGIL